MKRSKLPGMVAAAVMMDRILQMNSIKQEREVLLVFERKCIMVHLARADKVFILFITCICTLLYFIPGELPLLEDCYILSKATVVGVDGQNVRKPGIVNTGDQGVAAGPSQGQNVNVFDSFLGKPETDKMFQAGYRALAVLQGLARHIELAGIIDYHRIYVKVLLLVLFILLLIWYAGWTGVKAILSFVFTVLILWKVSWPLFLKGWDPVTVSLLVVCAIACAVTFLAAGFNRTGLAAFVGTMSGAVAACLLALLVGKLFREYGVVVQYSETLLHIGFSSIDFAKVFLSGIFLASSGAMMDVAMDIAVAVAELAGTSPALSRREAIAAGLNVGRAVIGTMTTTLLLAYSGSFTALMMMFLARGTPVANIVNLTHIIFEILHTVVGSFGVVLVAPFTALLAGWLLTKKSSFISGQTENPIN